MSSADPTSTLYRVERSLLSPNTVRRPPLLSHWKAIGSKNPRAMGLEACSKSTKGCNYQNQKSTALATRTGNSHWPCKYRCHHSTHEENEVRGARGSRPSASMLTQPSALLISPHLTQVEEHTSPETFPSLNTEAIHPKTGNQASQRKTTFFFLYKSFAFSDFKGERV